MGLFTVVRMAFDPIVQFLRFVPPIAWLIPAIMWFGIGETSKILIIFYMTVFLVLLNTMAGVADLRRNYLRAAQNYEVGRWQLFAWVVLPATMAYSVAGARIALGNSFAAVVGGCSPQRTSTSASTETISPRRSTITARSVRSRPPGSLTSPPESLQTSNGPRILNSTCPPGARAYHRLQAAPQQVLAGSYAFSSGGVGGFRLASPRAIRDRGRTAPTVCGSGSF